MLIVFKWASFINCLGKTLQDKKKLPKKAYSAFLNEPVLLMSDHSLLNYKLRNSIDFFHLVFKHMSCKLNRTFLVVWSTLEKIGN